MNNVETVQAIYAAFGHGDIPAILERIDSACVWEYGMIPNGVPWLESRKGKDGAGAFFQVVGKELEIRDFAVNHVASAGALVLATVNIDFTVKRTQRTVSERDEVHLWHFGPAGTVVKFRHVVDTLAHSRAFRGE